MKKFFYSVITLVILLSTGCRKSDDNDEAIERQFSPRITSMQALMSSFFSALRTRDSITLRSLAVTKEEFEKYLWPEFPMSDPAMNVPEGFTWENLSRVSEKGFQRLLRQYGGHAFEFRQLRFLEPDERYRTFVVHQSSEIRAIDVEGIEFTLPLRASIVEMNGTFKFMSFRAK